MRVLVIGAGSIGRRHAANLDALGARAVLLAWRETSAADVALRLPGFDAAVIATATDIRLPLIAACGAAGVPFYCEKPLAFRPADLDAIAAAAAPVAARSMVGFMMRYHAAFRMLADSDLAAVFRFHFAIGHDVTQWRAGWRFQDSYAARAEGGGVLLDLCHEIDMASCLFPGLALGAVHSLGHAAFPGVDMASHITLGAPNGAAGTVSMDYLCPRLLRHARLDAQGASLDVDLAAPTYRRLTTAADSRLDLAQDRNAMFRDAMADFLAHVSGRQVANPLAPRMQAVQESCRLIAAAWAARRFTGLIEKDFP